MEPIHQLPPDARIWVYQSNRNLTDSEVNTILEEGKKFVADWSAHGAALKAGLEVLKNRFIVLGVDERQANASGCSIDKSVHFMKMLEQKLNLNLFDRLQVAYLVNNELQACSLAKFEQLAQEGVVTENTIVFNNMVTTKHAFDNEWQVALKNSWQAKVLVA